MIENMKINKPAGWADDAPLEIQDPESTKPSDWDDEEVWYEFSIRCDIRGQLAEYNWKSWMMKLTITTIKIKMKEGTSL